MSGVNLTVSVRTVQLVVSGARGAPGAGQGYSDAFTGDGSAVTFDLSHPPLNNLVVAVGGCAQSLGPNFSLAGNAITFAEAPPNGAAILATYQAY